MALTPARLQEMLAALKAKNAAAGNTGAAAAADALAARVATVSDVDTRELGMPNAPQEAVEEAVQEILEESIERDSKSGRQEEASADASVADEQRVLGVARKVTLNERQQLFNDTALAGKDVILIGAAGTGKTTSMRTVSENILARGDLPKIKTGTKQLVVGGPGMAVLAFTRKAVNNIRAAVTPALRVHTMTIHKLLEYEPEFSEVEDPNRPGTFKTTVTFRPNRTAINPLPPELARVAFEESSMLGTDLYDKFTDAMPHEHQEIFLGDIQQLPPVFGRAILGFKLLELPVVELTEVYRQARESPIIDLAWKLLEGKKEVFDPKVVRMNKEVDGKLLKNVLTVPALEALNRETEVGSLKFSVWQKQLHVDNACIGFVALMKGLVAKGEYDPQRDIILTPYNKSFGTIELNKGIANFLGLQRGAVVHEVLSGRETHYLAVGDRVLYDKEDAFITEIRPNPSYLGKPAAPASKHMDRWGGMQSELSSAELEAAAKASEEQQDAFINKLLGEDLTSSDEESITRSASHIITIRYAFHTAGESDVVQLSSTGDVNNLLGGYVLTVHKSQGSEWEKVFLVLHYSQATMMQRELLYTGVTRARKHLHILCESNSFYKGIQSQSIPGNTWEEKSKVFRAELGNRKRAVATRTATVAEQMAKERELQAREAEERAAEERRQEAAKQKLEALRATGTVPGGAPAAAAETEDERRQRLLQRLLLLKGGRR